MTTKRICYSNPDGSICIVVPAPQGRLPEESEDDWIERIRRKDVPTGVTNVTVLDSLELPSRKFRSSWRANANGKPEIHLGLAKAELIARVRAERNAKLDDSDKVKSRLDDIGTADQVRQYKQYRQALRDYPTALSSALASVNTVEDLLKLEPVPPKEPDLTINNASVP